MSSRCDNVPDCLDRSDEEFCTFCRAGTLCKGVGCVYTELLYHFENVCPVSERPTARPSVVTKYDPLPPAEIYLDGHGMSRHKPVAGNCSDTTFRCQSGLCIPSYMINNGEKDCPYGEDEDIPWENVTCPGYYRCYEYGLCLHPDLVCNGVYECPNKDDERYCDLPCPGNCTCEGFAYTCSDTFDPRAYLGVRYLDVSETHISDIFLQDMYVIEYLRFLNLSHCQLRSVTMYDMPQLLILDLSYNLLNALSLLNLRDLSGLTWLDLSHNPLVPLLDLSFSAFLKLASLTNLETLLLTNTEVTSISNRALSPLSKLVSLDLSDNKLTTYGFEMFQGVSSLQILYSDDGKLCCEYFHQHSLDMCYAPVDELSSCSDLLRSDLFRVFLWTLSVLSIAGNAGVLVYRTIADEQSTSLPFRLLVKNLCASDLLMGVYLMMIGVADEQFRGQYVEKEREWRHSAWCTAAGFLAFVSSEVSALVICCITLDRLLVLCYPLKANIHLKAKSVIALCCCVWCTCLVLAAVPLVAGLEFYGQNGICLPLPITRQQISEQFYAFAVFIVFNFVLFVLVGVGQLVIYTAVRRTGAATGSKRRQQDTTIARRLFLVVFTDFCCWFPVGLIGLLAFSGVPIPGVVNVWIAIFVLPLNSALNPFLYILNTRLEKVEKRQLEARTKRILMKLQTEIPKLQANKVEDIALACIQSKLVQQERFLRLLGFKEDQTRLLEKSSVDKVNTSGMSGTP
ncbi:G-protein coupled receptor GRL101-like [Littorina saxatilis]|uniref:G-protein coupled receptor GRL101-like n=1 Tax=Littorina saxatilis TaxID=31220 RepID=UPI0038B5D9EE